MKALIAAIALFAAAPASASDTPYAGLETREIKALSDERRDGLLTGQGLGYALSAELNGIPGPRHVLDMAEALDLSDAQREQTQALFDAMNAEARRLGAALIAAEAELDALFASGEADPQAVAAGTAAIAEIEGALRATHLNAHLATAPLLSRHQRVLYARARGYGADGHGGHSGHH